MGYVYIVAGSTCVPRGAVTREAFADPDVTELDALEGRSF
jgi:hypothetical protein